MLTRLRQYEDVPGRIAVGGYFNRCNAKTRVHTQEICDKTRNVWGSYRRPGDDVDARTDLIKVSALSVNRTLIASALARVQTRLSKHRQL